MTLPPSDPVQDQQIFELRMQVIGLHQDVRLILWILLPLTATALAIALIALVLALIS